jgi:hypothetical protein
MSTQLRVTTIIITTIMFSKFLLEVKKLHTLFCILLYKIKWNINLEYYIQKRYMLGNADFSHQ